MTENVVLIIIFKANCHQELKIRLNKIFEEIKQNTADSDTLKILMITHKVLAAQQGYERLLSIINDGLRDKEDPFLLFLWTPLNQSTMH